MKPLRTLRTHPTRLVGWAHRQSQLGVVVVLAGSAGFGCDKPSASDAASSATALPAPSSSVPAAKPKAVAPEKLELSCREEKHGARFLVGEVGKVRPKLPERLAGPQTVAEDDDGDAIDLPFAVEAGGAVATSDGFALAALEHNKAVAVTLARDGASGTTIELAEVHGDVEPPRLASNGERVVAAVVGNDAGSSTLTLMAFQPARGSATLKRGAQVSRSREAGAAFDLALSATRGLMAWDQWDSSKSHGTIEALGFDPVTLEGQGSNGDGSRGEPGKGERPTGDKAKGEKSKREGTETGVRVLSGTDDAESPRVIPRTGGFWLSWVSHGPPAKTARKDPSPDAGTEAEYDSVVEVTPRRLKLLPLDERGVPTAEPTLVTAPDAHVLAYDVVPFGDGVLLAWRDDPTSLGAEAPNVHLARVQPDGTVTPEVIDDEEVAEGTPRLFTDRDAAAQPRTWLGLMGKRGRSRLGYLDPAGKLAAPLQDVAGFGLGEPLALESSRFLLGEPRGQALDLFVVRCAIGSSKPQK